MLWLYGKELPLKKKGYHYWCDACNHGWYIADLSNIASQNLSYAISKGKSGKSPAEIKETILREDAKVKEEGGEMTKLQQIEKRQLELQVKKYELGVEEAKVRLELCKYELEDWDKWGKER